MKLHIRNMVCDRCKMAVQTKLIELGLHPISVNLGDVEIEEHSLDQDRGIRLSSDLAQMGFELLANPKQKMVDAIKSFIINLVHYTDKPLALNLSTLLAENLNSDYQTLSATFSDLEQNTIEKYFIAQKIERVKELLSYGDKTLSEIANQMNYSSVAHLSAQFKNVTGLTPSQYKNSGFGRQTLDQV